MSTPATPLGGTTKDRYPEPIPLPSQEAGPQTALPGHERARESAGAVGNVLGRALARASELPRRVEQIQAHLATVRRRTREDAAAAAAELKESAQRSIRQARLGARDYINRYPLHSLAVVAGAAFVLGFALRIMGRRSRVY